MAALGLNLGYLLVQMFSFLVMFVVLRAWVYGPVLELLAARREKISKSLEDAR
ncbi:MAG: F0F1 ATP synthase subunit B, partial [Chloroflexi bacterium]|nr:F0F1 ATP synthase subunit B [Chloroflexota bacterium]